MGIREIVIASQKLVIHELDDVYDSINGCALTGSWLWGSALILSEWMASLGSLTFNFEGKTVLELGAGTGLPGLTAARLGSSRVILTDMEPLLKGLKKNVEANGLGDRVEVSELIWGSEDWPSQLSEVDLVLMSDVFFDAAEMAALAKTLRRVCSAGTRVWAASEVRPWTSEVLNELVSEGFGVCELPSQLDDEFLESVTRGGLDLFVVLELMPPRQNSENLE
ncbi:hypothetical protein LguiA_015271 [Lonicera macranthoides]